MTKTGHRAGGRGEWDLVAGLGRRALPGLPEGAVGPGDDAAVLPWGDEDLVVTTDLIAEGTHFHCDAPPEDVGRFAAAVNLSDLAAMGAQPRGFVAACAAPSSVTDAWFEGVTEGLVEMLTGFDCPLVGGDTKTAPARMVAGTAFGSVPSGDALLRSGAKGGDVLVATGRFGRTGALLSLLAQAKVERKVAMHEIMSVEPRIRMGRILRDHGAHAAVDTSDGLARSADLLAKSSGVALRIDLDAVPVDPWVQKAVPGGSAEDEHWQQVVLGTGGEYELLAAVAPDSVQALTEQAAQSEVPLSVVGDVQQGSGVRGKSAAGEVPLAGLGWRQR